MAESKLDQILRSLGDDERTKLQEVLASTAQNVEIAALLTDHGHPISETAIRRWRRK